MRPHLNRKSAENPVSRLAGIPNDIREGHFFGYARASLVEESGGYDRDGAALIACAVPSRSMGHYSDSSPGEVRNNSFSKVR